MYVQLQEGLKMSEQSYHERERVLTESVSGDRRQRQSVVSHRLILDYLQMNKEKEIRG